MNVEFAAPTCKQPPVAQSHLVVQGDVRQWTALLHRNVHSEHALERHHHTLPGETGWLHGPLGRELARDSYGTIPVANIARRSFGVRAFLIYARYAARALRQYLPVTPFVGTETSRAYAYNGGYYVMHVDAEGESRDSPEALGGLLVVHYAPGTVMRLTLLQLGSRYDDGSGGLFVRVYEMDNESTELTEYTTQSLLDARFAHPLGAVARPSAVRTRADAARDPPSGVLARALLSAIGLDVPSAPSHWVASTSFVRHKAAGASLVNFFAAALYSAIAPRSLAPSAALTNVAVLEFVRVIVQMSVEERASLLHALPQRMAPTLIEHTLDLLTDVYGMEGVREQVDLESWAAAILTATTTSGAKFARYHAALVCSGARKNGDKKADDDDEPVQLQQTGGGVAAPSLVAGAIDEQILSQLRRWMSPRDMRGLSLATRDLARKALIFGDPRLYANSFRSMFPFFFVFINTSTTPPAWVFGGRHSTASRLAERLRAAAINNDRRTTIIISHIVRRERESESELADRRADRKRALAHLQARRLALLARIDPVLNASALDSGVLIEQVRAWQLYNGVIERALSNPALRRLLPADIANLDAGGVDNQPPRLVKGRDLERVLSERSQTRWVLDSSTMYEGNANVFTADWTTWINSLQHDLMSDVHPTLRLRGLYYAVDSSSNSAQVEHTLVDEKQLARADTVPAQHTLSLVRLVNDPSVAADIQWPPSPSVDMGSSSIRFPTVQAGNDRSGKRFEPLLQMVDRRKSTVEIRYVSHTIVHMAPEMRTVAGGIWRVTDVQAVSLPGIRDSDQRPWMRAAKQRWFVYAAADRTMLLAFMQHAEGVLDALPDTARMAALFRKDVFAYMETIRTSSRMDYLRTKAENILLISWPFVRSSSTVIDTNAAILVHETVYESLSDIQQKQVDIAGAYVSDHNSIVFVWTRGMRRYYRQSSREDEVAVIVAALVAAANELFDADSREQRHSSPIELAWLRFMYVRAGLIQFHVRQHLRFSVTDVFPRLPYDSWQRDGASDPADEWYESATKELRELVTELRTAPVRSALRPATQAQIDVLYGDSHAILIKLGAILTAALVDLNVFIAAQTALSTDASPVYAAAATVIGEQMHEMSTMRIAVSILAGSTAVTDTADNLEAIRKALVAAQNSIAFNTSLRSHTTAIERITRQFGAIAHAIRESESTPLEEGQVRDGNVVRPLQPIREAIATEIATLTRGNVHRHPALSDAFAQFTADAPEYVTARHAAELDAVRAALAAENQLHSERASLRASLMALDSVSDTLETLVRRMRQAISGDGEAFESELTALSAQHTAVTMNDIIRVVANTLSIIERSRVHLYPNLLAALAQRKGPDVALAALSASLHTEQEDSSFSAVHILPIITLLRRLHTALVLETQNYEALETVANEIDTALHKARAQLFDARRAYKGSLQKPSSEEESEAEKAAREAELVKLVEVGNVFNPPFDAFAHMIFLIKAYNKAYNGFTCSVQAKLKDAARVRRLGMSLTSEVLAVVEEERALLASLPVAMEEDSLETSTPSTMLLDPVQQQQSSTSSSSSSSSTQGNELSSILQIAPSQSFQTFLADPSVFALDGHEYDIYVKLPYFSAIDERDEIKHKKLDWSFAVYGVRNGKRVEVARGGVAGVLEELTDEVTIELFVVDPRHQGYGRRILRFVRDKLRTKDISIVVSRVQLRTAKSFWAQMEREHILGAGSFAAAFTTTDTSARRRRRRDAQQKSATTAVVVQTGVRGGKTLTLRERIVALDRACGNASRLARVNSPKWRRIIEQSLVPQSDSRGRPMTLDDVVKIRGRCVSKRDISALTKDYRNINLAPPWPFEGEFVAPFTAAEMRAAGLDPQKFRYFRSTAPPAAPRAVALELEEYVAYVYEIDTYSGEDIVDQLYSSITYRQFYEAVIRRLLQMSQRSEAYQRRASTVTEVQRLLDSNVELTIAHLEDEGDPDVAVILQWEPMGWVRTQLDLNARDSDLSPVYASAIEYIVSEDFVDAYGRRYAPSTIDEIDAKLRTAVAKRWPNAVVALVALERAWGKTRIRRGEAFKLMSSVAMHANAARALSAWGSELDVAEFGEMRDPLAALHCATLITTGARDGDMADDDDDDDTSDEETEESVAKRQRMAAVARKKMGGLNAHSIDQQIITRIQRYAGVRGTRGLRLATRGLARTALLFTKATEAKNDFVRLFPFFARILSRREDGAHLPTWIETLTRSTAVVLADRLRDAILRHDDHVQAKLGETREALREINFGADEIASAERTILEQSHYTQARRQRLLARVDPLLGAGALDTSDDVEVVRQWHLFEGLVERALSNPMLRTLLPNDIGGTTPSWTQSRIKDVPTTLSRAPTLIDASKLEALLAKHNAPSRNAWRYTAADAPYSNMFVMPPAPSLMIGPREQRIEIPLTGLYYVARWEDRQLLEHGLYDPVNERPVELLESEVPMSRVTLLRDPPTGHDREYDNWRVSETDNTRQRIITSTSIRLGPRYLPLVQIRDAARATVEARHIVRPRIRTLSRVAPRPSVHEFRTVAGGLWKVTKVDTGALVSVPDRDPALENMKLLNGGPLSAEPKQRIFTYAAADRTAFMSLMQDAANVIDALPDTEEMKGLYFTDISSTLNALTERADAGVPLGAHSEVTYAILSAYRSNVETGRAEDAVLNKPVILWRAGAVHPVTQRIGLVYDNLTNDMQLAWNATTRRYYRWISRSSLEAAVKALRSRADELFDRRRPENAHASALELAFLQYLYMGAGFAQFNAPPVDRAIAMDVVSAGYLFSQGVSKFIPVSDAFFKWGTELSDDLRRLVIGVRDAPLRSAFQPASVAQLDALRLTAFDVLTLSKETLDGSIALLSEVIGTERHTGVSGVRYSMNRQFVLALARTLTTLAAQVTDLRVRVMEGTPKEALAIYANDVAAVSDALRRKFNEIVHITALGEALEPIGNVVDVLSSLAHRIRQAEGPRGSEFEREFTTVMTELSRVNWRPVIGALRSTAAKLKSVAAAVRVMLSETTLYKDYSEQARAIGTQLAGLGQTFAILLLRARRSVARLLMVVQLEETDAETIETLSDATARRIKRLEPQRNDIHLAYDAAMESWGGRVQTERKRAGLERMIKAYSTFAALANSVVQFYDHTVTDALFAIKYGEGTQALSVLVSDLMLEERATRLEASQASAGELTRAMDEDDE